jgi:two-component system, OmpR family, alkaline phosphatase synthesis response regulator PhoP
MARESILVVEDEEDIQDLVRFHLAREGYQVRGVVTGEDALAAIKQHSWDLVLLDLMLPGIDGLSVARRIRSDSEQAPFRSSSSQPRQRRAMWWQVWRSARWTT